MKPRLTITFVTAFVSSAAEGFGPVCMALNVLEQELLIREGKSYSQAEVLAVFSSILASENRSVPYQDLVQKLGERKADQMIERNIMCYRPASSLGKRFGNEVQPVLTAGMVVASGTPAILAMKILLERFTAKGNAMGNSV
jgi:hypothetical protein